MLRKFVDVFNGRPCFVTNVRQYLQDEGNIICPECARKKIMAEMEERNE